MPVLTLKEAIERYVHDGDSVALEGFTHLIPFAAGHEIVRQGRRRLHLIRMTPDLVYDQMIGMGCADRLTFSWGGNPGVGSLHRLRDAVEKQWPAPLQIFEHTHAERFLEPFHDLERHRRATRHTELEVFGHRSYVEAGRLGVLLRTLGTVAADEQDLGAFAPRVLDDGGRAPVTRLEGTQPGDQTAARHRNGVRGCGGRPAGVSPDITISHAGDTKRLRPKQT